MSRARGCQLIPTVIAALGAMVTIACSEAPSNEHGDVGGGAISAQDVHHFVQAFARWTPADSSCVALEPYWSTATRGLESYASKFDVSHADLCRQIRRRPERYASLAAGLPALDSAAARVRDVYAKLAALHPLSNSPSVYFVVGDGIDAGTTTRGKHPIILIGMELNNSIVDRPSGFQRMGRVARSGVVGLDGLPHRAVVLRARGGQEESDRRHALDSRL